MDVFFLEAAVPLTKTISPAGKKPYPMVKNFTSIKEVVNNPLDFFKHVRLHAKAGRCLLKGPLLRPLTNESRATSTSTDDKTEWVCLDFDRFETPDLDAQLSAMGLGEITYVLQYSSSHGLPENEGTVSAHVFMLLEEATHAPLLKAWLMNINLSLFRDELRLSRCKNQLSWPLDISTCQNDKLLYVATPKFIDMDDPMGEQRIQLITRPLNRIPRELISERHIDALKQDAKEALNTLRGAEGLRPRKAGTVWVGEREVLSKPNSASVTGVKDAGDWVRLNLNGGDSWAYSHPKENFEYLYDFKSDMWYRTKEIVPGYYTDLRNRAAEHNATPTDDGDLILAFRDKRTSEYYNGIWNPREEYLELHRARNETQLDHWMRSHGRTLGDFIPVWEMDYNPRENWVVDEPQHRINTFNFSPYIKAAPNPRQDWPTIYQIICHMLGESRRSELTDRFLNWFAAVFQRKFKPLTAWVLHGIEGCVAGDTIINYNRGSRVGGRPLTIKEAFEKWSGTWKPTTKPGKAWDRSLTTRARAVKDGMTVGFHEVMRIVESGEQQLYKLTDNLGNTIRVTYEHPFMRPDGTFTKLCDLKPGDEIVRRGEKNAHARTVNGRNKSRATVHSIPHHPYAWRHVINGKNYKRSHKARLVWEAHMNGLPYERFIEIIKNEPEKAKLLDYLREDIIVHHLDENPANDDLSNLALIDKLNHDQHHAKETGLGKVLTRTVTVTSIVKDKVEMTYDMTMKAPYHNYEANGFIVSNTGKGFFINQVANHLLGHSNTTSITVDKIEDSFNGWIDSKLLVYVDEVDVDDFQAKGRVTARLRNYITEPTISIRHMRQVARDVDNYASFIFSSNRPQPVYIPESDRRYNVGNFQRTKLEPPDKVAVKNELQAFAEWLADHKVDVAAANTPLQTDERQRIQRLALTSINQTCKMVTEGDLGSLWLARADETLLRESGVMNATTATALTYNALVDKLVREALADPNGKITRDELLVILQYNVGGIPTSPNKFSSFLRHNGLETKRIRKYDKLCYGIETVWHIDDWLLEEIKPADMRVRRVK